MHILARRLFWGGLALLGAIALGVVALQRGKRIGALWLLTAAGRDDGLDFVPTHGGVLFGHHFAE